MLRRSEAGLRKAMVAGLGFTAALGAAAGGCVSYWDLRRGEELPYGCVGELLWFPDADGDAWGDPGTTGEPSCGPIEDEGRTASNARDCDDSDPGITGRVGTLCPTELAEVLGGSPCVEGMQVGNSELVATCGESPPLSYDMAVADCGHWSAWDTSLPTDAPQPMNRGLAALETEPEANAVTTWLAEAGEPRAVWVDLRWVGTADEGAWQWPDGTSPAWIPPCGIQEPLPADFFPNLVPGLEGADETIAEMLPRLRLALIFDGVGWCRGIPPVSADPRLAGAPAAHPLCERPRPVLAEYAVEPKGGGGDAPATPGPGM